jgi:hypothetical protein
MASVLSPIGQKDNRRLGKALIQTALGALALFIKISSFPSLALTKDP